ncbi:hypothetical protein KRP22_002462 [Phytophthora ramorum]|nr:hypothetical protein KRP22_6110 [Phytophthora ramorum]
MIEFTAWEVYAYEGGNNINSSSVEDRGTSGSLPEDQSSVRGGNRLDRVVLAEHLPQISDKALTFESYHIHSEKGIFGGRHDGAIMHWPLSQTPSVTIPSVRYKADKLIGKHEMIWSFSKKAVMCSFKAHSDAVCSLTMHGCFLFSGSDDTFLRMWNMFDLSETYELGDLRPPSSPSSSGSGSPIVCLDVVPFLGLVLSGAADGTLIIWDYTAFEDENAFDAYGKIVFRAKVDGHVKCLQCWPGRKAMICGTAEGKLLVFDLPPQFFDLPPEPTESLV